MAGQSLRLHHLLATQGCGLLPSRGQYQTRFCDLTPTCSHPLDGRAGHACCIHHLCFRQGGTVTGQGPCGLGSFLCRCHCVLFHGNSETPAGSPTGASCCAFTWGAAYAKCTPKGCVGWAFSGPFHAPRSRPLGRPLQGVLSSRHNHHRPDQGVRPRLSTHAALRLSEQPLP